MAYGKYLFILLVILAVACSPQSKAQENNTKEHSKNSIYQLVSKQESDATAAKLTEALKNARNNPVNDTIIYGFIIGMDEDLFDAFCEELAAKGTLKKSGFSKYNGEYNFSFEDHSIEAVDISCSSSGVFKNFPRITFKTVANCDNPESVTTTRNKFIDWAISKYGTTYYVTLNHSMPDGKNMNLVTNNYTWICGSYQLDITIGMCQVAITYSKI